MDIDVVILAAGKGSRMKSAKPKVLQTLAGKSLLAHVLETARTIDNAKQHVVIGHEAEQIKQCFVEQGDIHWAMQTEQLGTGHAVAQAVDQCSDRGITLVLYGDVPLVAKETLTALIKQAQAHEVALLTVKLDNPTGYGRIVRDQEQAITAIVEQKDANAEQLKISEVNSGILALNTALVKQLIPELKNNNAQGEYYLTDIIALAKAQSKHIASIVCTDEIEVQGVNDKKQLAQLERAYQAKLADKLLEQGVSLADPKRIDIRGSLNASMDVFIDVNCVFQGDVSLGENVSIAANCVIGEPGKTVVIGANTQIKANSVIEQASIGSNCMIGPYARIRPTTILANNSKIGNFVETKNANIADGAKVNHLSYVGDVEIGANANIGAGTITCNYDGVNKHKTEIAEGAFIGSNSSLVAPVRVGIGATVGAGSTITSNVADEQLAVARGKQRTISGWKKPEKK